MVKMGSVAFILFFIIGTCLVFSQSDLIQKKNVYPGLVTLKVPKIVTTTLEFPVELHFSPLSLNNSIWSKNITYQLYTYEAGGAVLVLSNGIIDPYNKDNMNPTMIKGVDLSKSGLSGTVQVFLKLTSVDGTSSENYEYHEEAFTFAIPAWLSILPSIITIILAVWLKQTLLSLFAGIWLGSTFLCYYNPAVGLLRALDTLIIQSLTEDPDRVSVIYFCLLIGGMIAVIGKGGGAIGMANLVTKFASNRKRSMLATWGIGVLTFFDDYASCLITGSTMKDITGRLYVSREKLSFIVDTCAATISSLMIVSSWIGFELSNIAGELAAIGIDRDPYLTFLETLAYRFYPILVLFFCLMIIITNRDFGPMLAAERRAVQEHKLVRDGSKAMASSDTADDSYLSPKEGKPKRWFNAVIPFLLVVIVIITGMVVEGYIKVGMKQEELKEKIRVALLNGIKDYAQDLQNDLDKTTFSVRCIFAESSSFHGLIWASFIGSAVSIILVMSQKILTLDEAMDAWLAGTKSMLLAVLILMHAYALSSTCKLLYTSQFVSEGLKGNMPPGLLPMLVFVLGAFVSFSTGSAWGTMALLFPLMIPLANTLGPGNWALMLNTISSILSGAVWGNHSSPIADSCIMSSMSTGSDHTDHVKTQGVYAVVVGVVSIITCSLPVGMEWYPWYVGLLLGAAVLLFIIYAFGRHPEASEK